ncbi:LEAF RUST 10 DISEASE-RESISTANCE LOCUS RECEPTOR-LIKE PROTEIN KINASE-like 1.2 isoform X1 [Eucalyptus grandis]|uniref:LEAF RUST 10 DISEASE-RESISTANCE LOCUS RECEPTOR-LIKE PROTEIN KINASE-like 1.2 isoform X1 n=1 Tax=Eucalyptus grandis TaxID=71139 RepID=UPI00192EADB0|nr:LEAF RUST 10 DISEASE-RESISTANCE LOCUS RECEPTOR-LIKE PROTEIN KINASE-like 1.2 isoform X1 [Eucalyptus grandis]
MDLTISCFSLSLLFFIISLQIHFLVPASGYFKPFQECVPYPCGDQEISYPFKHNERPNHCGFPGYELGCDGDNLTLSMESLKYWVIHIDWSTHILEVARTDLWDDICPETHVNTTLNCSLFNYASTYPNSTLFYDCDSSPSLQPYYWFPCPWSGDGYFAPNATIENPLHEICNISVPVPFSHIEALGLPPPPKDSDDRATISEFLKKGFEITWIADTSQCENCNKSGGRCGYDWIRHQFNCFCPDGAHSPTCNGKRVRGSFPSRESNRRKKLVVGFASAGGTAGGIAIIVAIIIFIYRSRQRKKYNQSSFASRSTSSIYFSRTDSEKGNVYHGLPIFDYDELKNATNNFDPAAELGDGGFGTVFKGKLQDGRVVAVKRLYESNYKRVEQFVNEVEILARLRHPNLVSLYGCTSRQSRRLLLVYEYVPNGTVADHIHGDLAKPGSPPWSTRLNIAIETANALVYLHASVVIHRDVKTNNILLNENFSVKVADFGLSRLFPLNATHVSTAPQGTPGYVDPEYHQCYQLTEKSDVYSFGVVLMELISSLPAVDITRHRHEINLSALAISKIQSHALHELVDPNLGFDTDYRTGEMITAVAELGFQCLEQGHDMRPSMEEVLKTLKEIQNRGHDMEKSDQTDNISDDAVLLKNNPLTSSPVSVTAKWVSNDSTPNASG